MGTQIEALRKAGQGKEGKEWQFGQDWTVSDMDGRGRTRMIAMSD
jgi:hypothetical protein